MTMNKLRSGEKLSGSRKPLKAALSLAAFCPKILLAVTAALPLAALARPAPGILFQDDLSAGAWHNGTDYLLPLTHKKPGTLRFAGGCPSGCGQDVTVTALKSSGGKVIGGTWTPDGSKTGYQAEIKIVSFGDLDYSLLIIKDKKGNTVQVLNPFDRNPDSSVPPIDVVDINDGYQFIRGVYRDPSGIPVRFTLGDPAENLERISADSIFTGKDGQVIIMEDGDEVHAITFEKGSDFSVIPVFRLGGSYLRFVPTPEGAELRYTDEIRGSRIPADAPQDRVYKRLVFDHSRPRFSYLSERIMDEGFFRQYSADFLRLMRNEIMARYGYVFKDPGLRAYFEDKPWYSPDEATEIILNPIEEINMVMLKNAEARAKKKK